MRNSQPKDWNGSRAEDICLACGLCCSGAIFANVKLQQGDDAVLLERLGLPLRISHRKDSWDKNLGCAVVAASRSKFPQPCAAYDGCLCRIHEERPRSCREFDCALLTNLRRGLTGRDAARRTILKARNGVERIRRLLRGLGDGDEALPLATRFRRTSRRLEKITLQPLMASRYGALTLAVHDLNCLLSMAFYPGAGFRGAVRGAAQECDAGHRYHVKQQHQEKGNA